MYTPTNLREQFDAVTDYWSPRVIGQVNDQYLKVAKVKGQLTWHNHEDEDELFYIVKGQLLIQFEDGKITLKEGEFYTIPKGVMHNPVAEEEVWLMLIETVTTKHTGDVEMELTKSIDDQLT